MAGRILILVFFPALMLWWLTSIVIGSAIIRVDSANGNLDPLGKQSLLSPTNSIVVNTLADDNIVNGNCTLREAIIAANTNLPVDLCMPGGPGMDTITFDPSVSGTIVLTSTLPSISHDLAINGPGAGLLTISGNNSYRVMFVSFMVTLNLSNVTIADGNSGGGGGGIFVDAGTLNVNSVTFSGNRATGVTNGGAINNSGGTLTVFDTTFYSNSAEGTGGSIYSNGSANLTSSNVYSNTASSTGGGIYLSNSVMNLTASSLYSNTASSDGGGIYLNNSTLFLTSSSVYSNTAVNANGGAIFNNNGGVIVSNSAITSNVAISNSNSNGLGGGIYNYGALIIENSNLSDNRAGTRGGAILAITSTATIMNSTFSGNHAQGAFGGGGILLWFGSVMNLDRTSLYGNDSSSAGGAIGNLGTMTITNSSIYTNTAYGAGGIYNLGTLTMTNSTIANNRAANADGGGIYNASLINSPSLITITNSTIAGNSASATGGGIFNANMVTVTLTNTIVANNTASAGANCSGTIMDGGKNLQWNPNTGCGFALAAGDPKLAPLSNYGGPTKTMALFVGSAAIDTGNDAACPSTDQRGIPRPQGAHCDIGAYEVDKRHYLPIILK